MSTFEDTNVTPIVEKRFGEETNYGYKMTKCQQVKYCIENRDIQMVMDNMTKDGYDLGTYKEPGTAE